MWWWKCHFCFSFFLVPSILFNNDNLKMVQVFTITLAQNWCLLKRGALRPFSIFIAPNLPRSIKMFTALLFIAYRMPFWDEWINAQSILPHVHAGNSYEAKVEESEKAISHRKLNPAHLSVELPVLCHWATAARQLPTLTILYMYYTGSTECLSLTPGSHSACAIRTPGVDRKILSIRKEPMLSSILPHTGNNRCYEAKVEERGRPENSLNI